MLVIMACTLMIGAPIMCVGGIVMALHEDLGLSWLLGVSVPVLAIVIGLIVRALVPQFRLMQERIDTVNRVLREQLSGIRVVRAFVREPAETEAVRRREPGADRHRHPRRAADDAAVPDRAARAEPVQRRGALVRRRTGRQRADADRVADRVPHLSRADPDVGDDGDLHGDDGAARGRVRGAHQGGARHRVVRGAAEGRSRRAARARAGRVPRRDLPLSRARPSRSSPASA